MTTPFNQTAVANTPDALALDASTAQMFSAVIQQTPVRQRLNHGLVMTGALGNGMV